MTIPSLGTCRRRGSLRETVLPGAIFKCVKEPQNKFDDEAIRVELPGVDEKDVDVKLNGDELTVTAERKHNVATKDGDFHRVESHFGRFSRSLRLPDGLQTESIDATFKRGVLVLTVPKAPERTPTRIQVKSS